MSTTTKAKKPATSADGLSKKGKRWVLFFVWAFFTGPILGILIMLLFAFSGALPSIEELENTQSLLASEVYSADGELIGKYYRENRSNVTYNEISTNIVDCLVATEDERFYEHTGVDYEATARVVKGVVTGNSAQGGGSTITQQLAKLLFRDAKLSTTGLVLQKFKEWIIATRLERTFTKEEIITHYLNKFDFLHNAIGIKSAARVYFNTTPDSLTIEESAVLVGMLKNPSLYNPIGNPNNAKKRREVVLKQLLKANEKGNKRIKTKITQADYDRLRKTDIVLDYQKVDHAEGIAPYFREQLRKELTRLFNQKDGDGNYIYHKKDGTPYDINKDGLKIYSTIDSRMQRYAEWAVEEHLKKELQKNFDKELFRYSAKTYPFDRGVAKDKIESTMTTAIKSSDRYKTYHGKKCGGCDRGEAFITFSIQHGRKIFRCTHCKHTSEEKTEAEENKIFNTKMKMKVFSWARKNYEFDTVMTPIDSIKFSMRILRAALISVEPQTGFVKAWVGGPYFKHFKNDQVMGRRQVGSTFKPFVYASAFRDGAFSPCSQVPDIEHCIEVPFTKNSTKPWCPGNSGSAYSGEQMPLYFALPASMNNITAYLIKQIKAKTVINMLEDMGIQKGYLPQVPSICLGSCELSPYEMIGAQSAFANKGIFIKPMLFTRIEDKNGNVILDVEPRTSEAMDETTAYSMLQIMKGTTSGVIHPTAKSKRGGALVGGTGMRIRSGGVPYGGIKAPVAGKTGTTQNNTDGWFIGITPELATCVWVGAANSGVRFHTTESGQGASTSLPIWGYYMKKIYADKKIKLSQRDFEAPKGYKEMNCEDFKLGNSDLWGTIRTDEVEEGYNGTETDTTGGEEEDPYDTDPN